MSVKFNLVRRPFKAGNRVRCYIEDTGPHPRQHGSHVHMNQCSRTVPDSRS